MSALPATAVPLPLSPPQAALLAQLVDGMETGALHWLSGYAYGLATQPARAARVLHAVDAHAAQARATIVYGSQTGNARREAERLQHALDAAGLPARVLRADAYPHRELADERLLYLVFSTQGEGEPSDDARGFLEFLAGRRAPRLPGLHYAVLGLGDSSYPQFCAVGRQLDARLAELGAQRLQPLASADVDIETAAAPWHAQALRDARERLADPGSGGAQAKVTALRAATATQGTREAPFAAEVLAHQRITARDSGKDVRHLELSLAGSGLRYAPGDALGVWPRNPPALVDEVLATLRLDGDAPVEHAGTRLPLARWLGERRELTRLARPFLAAQAERAGDAALARLLEAPAQLAAWMARRQVIDVLRTQRADWDAAALVAALRPLAPRLYSIASSQKAVGDEAHLTVAHVAYSAGTEPRWGAASHFLAGAGEGAHVPVYVEANERFRLPADGSGDVIMIGPGTGVAPFRGFLQERVAEGASGRHWLFFGNPHFRSDFLYQAEWQEALARGQLQRLDVAFSRDGAGKVYVQHRLREHGRALFDWLEGGAHLYVCGATGMARDVHAALRAIVAGHGAGGDEAADEYLDALQRQGRYARDVY